MSSIILLININYFTGAPGSRGLQDWTPPIPRDPKNVERIIFYHIHLDLRE